MNSGWKQMRTQSESKPSVIFDHIILAPATSSTLVALKENPSSAQTTSVLALTEIGTFSLWLSVTSTLASSQGSSS